MSEYQTPESARPPARRREHADEQAPPLIAQVRKQPFSVLLLDEFEKAHPQIWDIFLQVFDDGRLTDRSGRTVDLRHCVDHPHLEPRRGAPDGPGVGFVQSQAQFMPASSTSPSIRSFRPEFLNRLDRVVVFRPLGRDVDARPAREGARTRCSTRRGFRMQPWAVEWDEAAVDFLIEKGFSAELGARPLKRAVERYLLTRLATDDRRAAVPGGRPVPLHHGARRRRASTSCSSTRTPAKRSPRRPRRRPARAISPSRGSHSSRRGQRRRPPPPERARLARRAGPPWDESKQDALAAAHEPASGKRRNDTRCSA